MRRSRIWLGVAAMTYAAAWLLPSIEGQEAVKLGRVPGWEATRIALSPLWTYVYQDTVVGPDAEWPGSLLPVLSGLTNLLFVWAAVGAAVSSRSMRHRGWEILLGGATALNTQWFLSNSEGRKGLRIGYYLWVSSFLLLAVAVHRGSQESSAREVDPYAA